MMDEDLAELGESLQHLLKSELTEWREKGVSFEYKLFRVPDGCVHVNVYLLTPTQPHLTKQIRTLLDVTIHNKEEKKTLVKEFLENFRKQLG